MAVAWLSLTSYSSQYSLPKSQEFCNYRSHFLSSRTQFVAFLVTQYLSGFVDGMIEAPTTYILDYNGVQHPNPSYSIWLRLDQLI